MMFPSMRVISQIPKGKLLLLTLMLMCVLTDATAARKPYSNTVFGMNMGSINSDGVFSVTDPSTGTVMTITNADYVTYYNPSRQNYYKAYLRLRNSSSETTITFKFTDPTLSLRSISYETNQSYSSWFGGYSNTYAFGERNTTGIENFTKVDDDTWSCTFSGVDNIQILSVGLWWDPKNDVIAHAPTGVTKSFTGTMQALFDLNPTYYAKSGQGNGEIGYKCKYNKTTNTALNMLFAGGEGTGRLDKGYATNINTYTIKWWYEGNSFKFSDVDVIYTKSQGSEDDPLGTFTSKIIPMTSTGVIAPSAKLLDYTGEPQVLVTAASSENGKAKYKLSTESEWSETIPTGTDAGDYVLSWFIESTNSSYEGYGTQLNPKGPIVITIRKVDIPSAPTPPTPLTPVYNTQLQLLASGGSATGGEIWFRVGEDGNWTQSPTASQVGEYKVYWYVKGDNNHNDLGSETNPHSYLTTNILQANYDMSGVKWSSTTTFTYDGTAKQGNVTVSQLPSTDISTTYTYKDAGNNTITEAVNAGTYTVTATFATSSSDFVVPAPMTTTFTIEPFNLQGAYVGNGIPDQNYTGAAIAPVTESTPGLSHAPAGLVIPYAAYTTTYLNNTNAGTNTATATLTANGSNPNYVGSKALKFSILKKSVEVSTADQSIIYGASISSNTGKATLHDAITGHTLSAVTLRPVETNYGIGTHAHAIMASDIHISDGSNDVTANYIITNPESRRGTLTVAVKPGGGFTISGLQAEYEGNGTTAVTPADVSSMTEVAVYDGSTKLVKGTDYTVSYANNTQAGTATATFTFQGNYSGSKTQNFEIYYLVETYSRQSASQYNYCTYYHPTEALEVRETDAKVYFCTLNAAKTEVELAEITGKVINAATPVMLRTPSTAKAVKLYAHSGAAADYTSLGTNALTGVTSAQAGTTISSNQKIYVFDGDSFAWANKGSFVAHKAYINGASQALARQRISIDFGNEDATSISTSFNDGESTDRWYDLQGNRINKPTRKGLYIRNGQKVVIK